MSVWCVVVCCCCLPFVVCPLLLCWFGLFVLCCFGLSCDDVFDVFVLFGLLLCGLRCLVCLGMIGFVLV